MYLIALLIIAIHLLGLAVIYVMTQWGKEAEDLENYKKDQK